MYVHQRNVQKVLSEACGCISVLKYVPLYLSLLSCFNKPFVCCDCFRGWDHGGEIISRPLLCLQVARWEHRTRRLSRLFGSPYLACYFLGFVIILLNVYRSHSMTVAMKVQARWEVMERTDIFYAGVAFMVLGTVLVVSSFLALGFTGTFLGDYFGILMDEKVTGFPFNIIENPMYWGSTANYLGLALMGASPVGLVLTAIVAVAYKVAIRFEGPPSTHHKQVYRRLFICTCVNCAAVLCITCEAVT
ncbi:hypothetical protein PAMP_010665 [Pampus punctatissimus]